MYFQILEMKTGLAGKMGMSRRGDARAASFTAEAGAEAVVASLLKPETLFFLTRREQLGAHLLYRLQNAWSM